MKTRAWYVPALLLLWLAGAAEAAEKRLDRTFDVAPGGRLTVVAQSGSINVNGTQTDQVVVHIVASGAKPRLEQLELSAEKTAGGVTVRVQQEEGSWLDWLLAGNRNVKITIEVPQRYHVDLKTSGGDIAVARVRGEVIGRTSGGNIQLADIAGPVLGQTSGGNVSAERITGDVKLKTSGGAIAAGTIKGTLDAHTSGGAIRLTDIEGATRAETSSGSFTVARIRGDVDLHTSGGAIRAESLDGKIRAHTSGGSIHVELVGANRGITVGTSGGEIVLRLPKGTQAELDAATSGGSVRSELAVNTHEAGSRTLRGTINGGGPVIHARTSGGSIQLQAT